MEKLVEGQTLWFVGASLGNFRNLMGPVTVTKVGRKWAELRGGAAIAGLGRYRLNVETLAVDGAGYSSPGRCYLSRLDWLDQAGSDLAWTALRVAIVNNPCPADLSFETITQVAQQLGLTLDIPQVKAP